MRVKAVVVALLATTAFVASPVRPADAAFSAAASGAARAIAQSVSPVAAPVAIAVAQDVTVTWSPATLSSGTPVTGYVVRRYNSSNVLQTITNNCISVSSPSCVELNVPSGTWKYTVQAQMGTWTGPESNFSAAITVVVATFTLSSTAPITTLPATVTGTIANYTLGATLTYRLDSPTGTIVAGTPTTVTNATSTSVSVTLPVGTTDAPHSIYVIDSSGKSASAAVNMVIPPVRTGLQMLDANGNGKVDQVLVTFDDTLAPYTAGIAPWTLTNVPSGGSLSGVIVSGNTATLTIAEGAGAANTAVGTFTVALAANGSGIRDVYDHPASFAATSPTDAAPPAVQALTALDSNSNGKFDRVTMSFSESLAAYSAPTTVWTLSNVPSGGTLASVAVTTPTVTLTLTEGAGAVNTATGLFNVALAANATGIRDSAGNQSSFSAAPADGARPLRQMQEMFDDDVDGKVDRLLVTFSEPLAPFTAAPSVFGLSAAPSGATANTVTVAGSQATIVLNQGAGAANTAVGTFTISLTANAAGIRDAAGNQASYTATAPVDRAAPVLVTLNLLDNNGNGKVDRVTAVFSETMSTYTAGTAPFTVTNVPSGGTLTSVALSTNTLTLTLAEGAGAADTTVGTMKVAMASNAVGARDATGNLGQFAATTPLDRAKPAAVTIADTNGLSDGRVEIGDTLVITFSEALAPGTVPSSTSVTVTDPVGTGNDTINISGITNGARSTGGGSYVTLDGGVAAWGTSAVALSNADKTVTVTVGGTCAGTGCAALGTQTTNGTFSFIAATTITDVIGNTAATAARTQAMRMF